MIAARPAGADAVGCLGGSVLADDVLLHQGEHFLAEGKGRLAVDAISRERHSSVQETHVRCSSSSPGRPDDHIGPDSRPVLITSAVQAWLCTTTARGGGSILPVNGLIPIR